MEVHVSVGSAEFERWHDHFSSDPHPVVEAGTVIGEYRVPERIVAERVYFTSWHPRIPDEVVNTIILDWGHSPIGLRCLVNIHRAITVRGSVTIGGNPAPAGTLVVFLSDGAIASIASVGRGVRPFTWGPPEDVDAGCFSEYILYGWDGPISIWVDGDEVSEPNWTWTDHDDVIEVKISMTESGTVFNAEISSDPLAVVREQFGPGYEFRPFT